MSDKPHQIVVIDESPQPSMEKLIGDWMQARVFKYPRRNSHELLDACFPSAEARDRFMVNLREAFDSEEGKQTLARSSKVEQRTHNSLVAGSTPAGPTQKFYVGGLKGKGKSRVKR